MPKGTPLTDGEQRRRRQEIFAASVHLFLDKGFTETSMREIAEAAGVGKSTLYDYFSTKEEILLSYFEGELQEMAERAREVIAQDLSARDKLRRIMRMHIEYLVANQLAALKLSIEVQRLSAESQGRIQAMRHAYQDTLRALFEDGARRGEFRPVNPLFAARTTIMLLSAAIFTSRPTGTPGEMLQEAEGILFQGILARSPGD